MKVVANRLTTTNAAGTSPDAIMAPSGTGSAMPNATKNSVTKKSRKLVTFAVTSSA